MDENLEIKEELQKLKMEIESLKRSRLISGISQLAQVIIVFIAIFIFKRHVMGALITVQEAVSNLMQFVIDTF